MPSLSDLLRLQKIPKSMLGLNLKDKAIKKKNSEIESRLFGKTKYYIIAVGKRPVISENEIIKVRSYVYYDGQIFFYSTQGRAYNQQEYINYIEFVKNGIQKERYEWTDFWINKGQTISRDKNNKIYVDGEIVEPFYQTSKLLNNISELSLILYYDFLRSINTEDQNKLMLLEDSFNKGVLKDRIERNVKAIDRKLDQQDGEIIVRTKIEGYNYIANIVKEIIASNRQNRFETIDGLFNRVFYLEMHGYIGEEE